MSVKAGHAQTAQVHADFWGAEQLNTAGPIAGISWPHPQSGRLYRRHGPNDIQGIAHAQTLGA